MKSTGIIRRIDDLGRIVIPKEIRRAIRIREGEAMEMFVDRDGTITLKKFSPVGQLGDFAQEYADSLYQSIGHIALVTDCDQVIAVAGGSKKNYLNMPVENYGDITQRKIVMEEQKVFSPIIAEGDIVGSVVLLANENYSGKFDNLEFKMAETASEFLAKQVEY